MTGGCRKREREKEKKEQEEDEVRLQEREQVLEPKLTSDGIGPGGAGVVAAAPQGAEVGGCLKHSGIGIQSSICGIGIRSYFFVIFDFARGHSATIRSNCQQGCNHTSP